jgi:hypothetical protein
MWRFALIGKKTIFSGDSLIFGLPLFKLQADVIHHHASMLWKAGIYGGHPLFAESQSAFMGLLPMVLAAIVTPITGAVYTLNLFAFLCLVLTGIGVIGLCRALDLGRWSSAFAALAVAFSPACLDMQTNAAISGSYLWIPWCLWATEIWLARPSLRSAAIMGGAMGSLILAGYPQAFHGTIIYVAVRLVTGLCAARTREHWLSTWRERILTGLLAVFLCAGLAAIQLLPLAELVGVSQRRAGIGLVFQALPEHFYRGMLYTLNWNPDRASEPPSVGSLLVCILASLLVVFNRSSRLIGHFIAGAFLLQLGFGWWSPLFRLLYIHDLLPGLHAFRTTYLYHDIGVIGVAISAAGAMDRVAANQDDRQISIMRSPPVWALPAVAILWAVALVSLKTPDAPIVEFVILFAAVAGTGFFVWLRRRDSVAVFLTALLFAECVFLRAQPFRLIAASNIAEPASVRAIESVPDWSDYKFADQGLAILQAYLDSRVDNAVPELHRMLSAAAGLTPVMWNLNGMDGALALPLARRMLARSLIADELNGSTAMKPGLRLVDVLAVRFIATDWQYSTPGLRLFWHQPGLEWIMENTAASKRFQIYSRHISVDSPEAAVVAIKSWQERTLVIENPPGAQHQAEIVDPPELPDAAQPAATLSVVSAGDTAYRLSVTVPRASWVFLADADYPGWTASVDGRPTHVFAAQLLGKAVWIPPGQHDLRIEFHSASFRWGAWISLLSLVATLLFVMRGRRPDDQAGPLGKQGRRAEVLQSP